MEQLIRTFLITHGLEAHVGATRLVFNKKDRVRGTHPYVMPGCIKSVAVRRFYKAFPEAKPEQLLCIGDTPSDVDLMHEGSLNIFILPPAEEYPEMHAYRSSHLEEMWNVADGFVLGTSLLPLVRFLHEALKENIARALL